VVALVVGLPQGLISLANQNALSHQAAPAPDGLLGRQEILDLLEKP
jgi:hypothetical protein